MKVKLKAIKPNPFRDFTNYPIQDEKVKSLESSIKDTGYWDKLIVRQNGDGIELVYGHHRLQALKNINGEDLEIEVSVKDYSDDDMIKIMANENDAAYNATPANVDESVKAVRDYLESNPEARRKVLSSGDSKDKRARLGAPMISKYLGGNFNQTKVQDSLARLNAIENGIVSAEAIYMFPSSASANNFLKTVSEYKLDENTQLRAANMLKDGNTFGAATIHSVAVNRTSPREIRVWDRKDIDYTFPEYPDYKLKRATSYIKKVVKELRGIPDCFRIDLLFSPNVTRYDISEETKEEYNKAVDDLAKWVKKVSEAIDKNRAGEEAKDD